MHRQFDRSRQRRAAGGLGEFGMTDLIGFHLLQDRAALAVCGRDLREVVVEVRFHLALGFHDETETPFVAGGTGQGADGE